MANTNRPRRIASAALQEFRRGTDENNLAEFPLALLSDAAAPGQRSIEFTDTLEDWQTGQVITRRVCVTGSDKFGLPTAKDEDVLLALVQLTKIVNNFTSAEVPFTKRQVIELLGWPTRGWAYHRVTEALHRWKGVSVHYWNAWREHGSGVWTDTEAIGVIDYFRLVSGNGPARTSRDECSKFVWNARLFQSFQAGYLKPLDFGVYRTLERPAAKRAYRFLDKRFHHRDRWEFDLRVLACEKLGFSRGYDTGQLKERLQPAMDELERIGFIEPVEYHKARPKIWSVAIAKKQPNRDVAHESPRETTNWVNELVERGVHISTASALSDSTKAEQLIEKLAYFDWLVARGDKRVSTNAPGFLVASIRNNYPLPRDYVRSSKAHMRTPQQQAAQRASPRPIAVARSPEPDEVDATDWLAKLSPDEVTAIECAAVAAARPLERASYERQRKLGGELFASLRAELIARYLRATRRTAA